MTGLIGKTLDLISVIAAAPDRRLRPSRLVHWAVGTKIEPEDLVQAIEHAATLGFIELGSDGCYTATGKGCSAAADYDPLADGRHALPGRIDNAGH